MTQNLAALHADFASGRFGPTEISARFVLLHLLHRHGPQFLSGPRRTATKASGSNSEILHWLEHQGLHLKPRQLERLAHLPLADARQLFVHYFFRGIALDSHEGLVGWAEGHYPLTLRTDIPTPEEMLDIQCRGGRYVSLLFQPPRALGRHADACAFLLHDLEHAHKFFAQPDWHAGQVYFFRQLRGHLDFLREWETDPQWRKDLDYLKADMNSHPVHLMKYLKAILLAAEIRRTGKREPELEVFWRDFFQAWEMPPDTLTAALNLNQPLREQTADHVLLRDFFSACR